ncbi:MAG: hypothetical protein C0187_06715 [Calditerrivibrio nitroreducens]|uniref:Uncharacterized protein n=1 Tax=Calditerrivibrio nitroreducens TaxID=477976 RepID=A0A2J6WGS7_9BACT|nr:MAG: hypothetical protein C0187_06715 [Calditerrivibrio nitroreducens]
MDHLQVVIFISVMTFFLNLPFGYWRRRFKKFSIGWFFCIHAPIPIVATSRIYSHLSIKFIPLFLVFAVLGQIIGYRLKKSN